MSLKFGVFDHVDDSGLPLHEHLAARLEMAEAYERAGIHCYHVAEHHGTPLGHAPSPGMLLAALSQRTRTLPFGPLVLLLPLYHPLRLIEEVAMLDALSGGRLQLGVGRGVSPLEMGFYGVDMEEQKAIFGETLEVLLKGLSSERLDHHGRFFQFSDVPMSVRPVQRPHPPLWYGTNSPESVRWCARERINIVTLAIGPKVGETVDLFRSEFTESGGEPSAMPLIGVSRHLVLAESESEANELAQSAYARWRASLTHLWEERGVEFPLAGLYPESWDAAEAMGHGCAGTPARVRDFVAREAGQGISYFASWFAFGDLRVDTVKRSVGLFAEEVMPAFA